MNYILSLSLLMYSSVLVAQNDSILEHDSFTIESKEVGETRTICVWTPPNYNENSDPLPVLYMPDGGIKEDFPHIANTIAKLVKNKSIPPVILVGIENTIRGRDLTGSSIKKADGKYAPITDGAKNFRAFISKELFVEINKRYRVSDKKGIIGESLAGLFVTETFLLNPDLFDFFIAMDPSLWWGKTQLVKQAKNHLANFPDKNIKFWFAGSSAKDISKHTNKLAKAIALETPKKLLWKYSDEPNEKHNTIFRATKEKALIWALNED